MAANNIWAPWRMSYILDKSDPQPEGGCLFCDLARREAQADNLILFRGPEAYIVLNRYPYSSCHLLVVPRLHARQLSELDERSYQGLMGLLRQTVAALERAVNPSGVNLGVNLGETAGAGIADHLHFHVVPRWSGDHNFMPVIANTMVMPEHLEATYDRLKPFFA
ncbi:MAG: HIT domain-containing protein [Deltaproteobacteria bacterium]|nr:HIT domain-containing protein [Deltaproteobacteria bacterium]